ncbi:MAG: hypothetical protein JW737_02945 [Acidobacteria bacterium]|nr:hypothetical protein [Acidobacteriota bacterium]
MKNNRIAVVKLADGMTSHLLTAIAIILLALLIPFKASSFTLEVYDADGNPVFGYRWLVQEDTTVDIIPGDPVSNPLAVQIHRSYAPVVKKGESASYTTTVSVPANKRYVVSVLPISGYTLSSNLVKENQNKVRVIVNAHPVPTTQISVFVFHDITPLNNAPDPVESGLEGFSIILFDAGGGPLMQDAFGNMLGTTYMQNPDGSFMLDVDGNPIVEMAGDGVLLTDANGKILIKYLSPGKYGIQAVPPAGQGWQQTSTIEGTRTVDAWVGANGPEVLVEFGPSLYHVFYGFVKEMNNLPVGGTGTISGRIVYNHFSKPPSVTSFFPGLPVSAAWIGLNSLSSSEAVYVAQCNSDSTFEISDVPAGDYQLVVFDRNLDAIFNFNTVVIGEGETVNLGDVLVFNWFGTLEGTVFYDENMNGFRDDMEIGIGGQAVNLRFRDGSIYQATATDMMGNYSLSEVFPFFRWLVVEVDFLRFNATGMTAVIDQGGEIPLDDDWNMPSDGRRNPQPQVENNPNTGNNWSRTEEGAVLTLAMQLFAGQNNYIDWGKINYEEGQNGGISGIIYYATTRAENDPRFAVGEPWEPGIPRVPVNLYLDANEDKIIDDLDGDGGPTLADVDFYPFDNFPTEADGDIDRDDDGVFDYGDAVSIASTDSWDDNMPTGSIGPVLMLHGVPVPVGYDNFATWNQVRPGVFDGGYAFVSWFPGGMANNDVEEEGLPSGIYIVEAVAPPGYEFVKEEDKNVDFGDAYIPGPLMMLGSPILLNPECVGEDREVPEFLTLFPGIECEFGGDMRPLPDRKRVYLEDQRNAPCDFFLFTEVPMAARAHGFINNDLAAEGDTGSPNYGEKQTPSWIPISFQDYAGNEVARVYCDEFGLYNALLPSTYSVNLPMPSGVSPNMLTFILNHPGPIPDPNNPGQTMIDPYFDPDYSQTAYTFDFWPGKTTYLDTPVIPVAAFIGYPNRILDVEPPTGTPEIYSVTTDAHQGPVSLGDEDYVIIKSRGMAMVPNPDYDPNVMGSEQLIERDFSFGPDTGTGIVTVGGVELTILLWTPNEIQAVVDRDITETGYLQVTRGDNGKTTRLGLTFHVLSDPNSVMFVSGGGNYPTTPIQDAIDSAISGKLIVIGPGFYSESPIIYKNVKLQGSGAVSTVINAAHIPSNRVDNWHSKIDSLIATNAIDPLDDAAELYFVAMEAPGVTLFTKEGVFTAGSPGLFDGFGITGGTAGGGFYVYKGDYFTISNNKIFSNQGTYGGGVVIGAQNVPYTNTNITISQNIIAKNGGVNGGGGISIYDGASNYNILRNLIIGNFTPWYGAGIAHYGYSDGGFIVGNEILFNESFGAGIVGGSGAGIYVAGTVAGGVGAGSVSLTDNLIQGNLAGSGHGGGIRTQFFSGTDTLGAPATWNTLQLFNNTIVNNVAAVAGGGISLSDVARSFIINNTIANNDSVSTGADAFPPGNLGQSEPHVGGIASIAHSPALATLSGQIFSNPILHNNIIWNNRSFYEDSTLNGGAGGLVANTPPVWDLEVMGVEPAEYMNPQFCLLTSIADPVTPAHEYAETNIVDDPLFVNEYTNNLYMYGVADEGGNFLTVRFDPLGPNGDYHITGASPAIDVGGNVYYATFADLHHDRDNENRPSLLSDIGADEYYPGLYSLFSTGGGWQWTDAGVDPQMLLLTLQGESNGRFYRVKAENPVTITGIAYDEDTGQTTITASQPLGGGLTIYWKNDIDAEWNEVDGEALLNFEDLDD